MLRRILPHRVSPEQMLRALRDQPGLAALFGDWLHGDAIIGIRPTAVLGADEDPFAALGNDVLGDDAPGTARDAPAAEGFGGGWIGYLGYQLSRRLESLPPAPPRAGTLPDHHLARYDHVLRHEAATGRWVCEALPGTDPARVARTAALVERALAGARGPRGHSCGPFGAAVSGDAHAEAVRRALAHIRDGDVFQVNVCRALEAEVHGDPLDLFCAGYERLRPRFAAFLRVPGGAVASLSPELYLRRTGTAVLTSPIKGTAPADTDPRELHASAKNRAENVMIVDLMRNDLSRACVPGSVLSPAVPRVEPHTGVHHLVADVHGTLRPGLDDAALLRSTFPPGSCTGAPKVRATEIINELETTARGVYTGAVGYMGPVAGLAMNVAIRTFEFSGSTVRLGVGGGVVADSDPDEEAFETLVKAAPLLDAVGACFGAELAGEWREHVEREATGAAVPACVTRGERVRGAGRLPAEPHAAAGRGVPGEAPWAASPRGPVAARNNPEPALPAPGAPVSGSPVVAVAPDASLGVFTTMLVRQGRPEQLRRHLARLGESVGACWGLDLPDALGERVTRRAAALDGPHRLRVTAVPGAAGLRIELTHAPLDPPGAPPPDAPWLLVPLVVPGGWGRHKWTDRRALDGAPGPWSPVCDPLLVDRDGTVLETGRANVFAVFDGAVLTPPADGRILPGVMRERVLGVLRAAGYEVREHPFTLGQCGAATEVFVTNSLWGARPVGEIRTVGRWCTGSVARHLQGALASPGGQPGGTTLPR